MTNLRYYQSKVRSTTVYSRFNQTTEIETVTMVDLGFISIRLSEVKRHLFNERIGDWRMISRTKSENKIKRELEANLDQFVASLKKEFNQGAK